MDTICESRIVICYNINLFLLIKRDGRKDMRRFFVPLITAMIFLVSAVVEGAPMVPNLPKVAGKPVLATVNGEPLTLKEFDSALASLHEGTTDNVLRPRSKPTDILERLINAKLILQEARNIGLDALPEAVAAVKLYEEDSLRGMLYGYHVRNIKKADKKETEKRYREAVKEVNISSILIEKEEIAKRFDEEIKSGGDFDEAAKRLLDAGEAKGSIEGKYMKIESLSPEVAGSVSVLKKGEVSSLLKIGKHFSILKVQDIRFPDDPAARQKAERDALQAKRVAALKIYTEKLRKKFSKVNGKLLDRLDFESKEPGFDSFLTDKRVIAKLQGEKPITVADLAKALQKKFFHGSERAAERKKLNSKKQDVLDEILTKRVILKEARRKKFDKTEYHIADVDGYRNGVLFGTFVQKVLDPDIKVEEAEIKTYIREHPYEYMTPEMIRMDSIVFSKREDAEDAIGKLRKGVDFQWMKSNADGQIDPKKAGNLLAFGGTLMITELPEGVRKVVAGGIKGDYRMYSEADGPSYVLSIGEVYPSKSKPFDDVKDDIYRKLHHEKRQKILREWEDKLRNASEVKIYATGEKLDRIVKPQAR